MANDLPKNVGWIGLGVMGIPMATNLLKKMSSETTFFVYDVVQKNIDDFVNSEHAKGRVTACGSSKEVADKSVRSLLGPLTPHAPRYNARGEPETYADCFVRI